MKKWLRKLRGAIGNGLTWAVGWAPVGAVCGWLVGLLFGFPLGTVALNYTVLFAVLGFLGGGIFSSVLSLTEGRRRFDELSLPRFTAWGAVGGFALGLVAVAVGVVGLGFSSVGIVALGLSTLLGAGSAAGTLAIARTGDGGPALPSDDIDEIGLTAEEERELLGRGSG